jgi:hypothetical protein
MFSWMPHTMVWAVYPTSKDYKNMKNLLGLIEVFKYTC